MALKEWTTTYSGANPVQDPSPVDQVGVQESYVDGVDEAPSSCVEKLRDKLDAAVRAILGDSANLPLGTVVEILDRDHANGDARQLRLRERGAAPGAVADKAFVYAKDDGGVTKVYVRWSNGTEVLLGSGGGSSSFSVQEASLDQNDDITSATWVPIQGSGATDLAVTVTTSIGERVLVTGRVNVEVITSAFDLNIGIGIDGADPTDDYTWRFGQEDTAFGANSKSFSVMMPAATGASHTYRVMAKRLSGTGTARFMGGTNDGGCSIQGTRVV